MVRTRLYRNGVLEHEDFPLEEVSDFIAQDGATVWVDFTSPTHADLATLEEELSLHHLAVEDAIHDFQRPKLDRYDSHLFLAAYDIELDPATGTLRTTEINAFITKQALVTVHKADFDMNRIVTRWDDEHDLVAHGVPFLLWGLLDTIVDGHFETVQQLDGAIDGLEDSLFDPKPNSTDLQRRSFELRKSLVTLRRLVLPMREVVNTLLRREDIASEATMLPYLQDVYDHVLRVTEWTESLRDLVTTVLETNISLQSNRMNLVMKKVTSWAAIIAVPTAITGFFGQNVPYPGFNALSGFWVSSALIVAISVALYLAFKRNDWL